MRLGPTSLFLAAFFLGFVLGNKQADAQDPTITVRSDAVGVDFGDSYQLTVIRSWQAGHLIVPFDSADLGLKRIVETNRSTTQEDGVITETIEFRCFAFQRGEIKIPSAKLTVHIPGVDSDLVAQSEPLTIVVKSILPLDDSGEVEAPSGPLPVAATGQYNLLWIIPFALLWICFDFFRAKRNTDKVVAQPWSLVSARAELALTESQVDGSGSEFYRGLMKCLVRFLDAQHQVDWGDKTLPQLSEALESEKFFATHEYESLEPVIRRAEVAIWGGGTHLRADRMNDLEVVESLILKERVLTDQQPAATEGPSGE